MRKTKKAAMLALLSGATLFSGCLYDYLGYAVKNLPGAVIGQWLTDNNGFLDLIPDGPTSTP